jgi:hypothetical protein
MTFIAIGTLALITAMLLNWRRAVEQRAIRWELYAKRDELRRLAYEDPVLLGSDIFTALDSQLTMQCATFDHLSLWAILPMLVRADQKKIEGRQKNFQTKLHQPKNRPMVPVYEGAVLLFARHLMWRHMFMTAIVSVTVLGFFLCYSSSKWLSERVVSAAVTPVFAGDFATLIWPTLISKCGPPATLTAPCRSQRDRGGLVGQESPRGVVRRDSTGVSVRHRDD